jgi:Rad3-related DNA helicase
MLIGAIIVGPGLPKVSFEQELIKEHYQNKYERGFDYAYLYPGMNRVVQSAGRVIRSEDDVGIIVLLDKRFSTPYYSSLFPKSWYNDSPDELISYDYEKDLEEFWDSLR